MLDSLRKVRIAAGAGEYHFMMQRGSFRYRGKTRRRSALSRKEIRESGDGFDVILESPKNGEEFIWRVREEDGIIRAELIPPAQTAYNRFRISFPADPGLHIYGCGELYSVWDLAGEKVRIFVAEHQNAKRISRKIIRKEVLGITDRKPQPLRKYESYYAQPTFTTSGKWFFHAYLAPEQSEGLDYLCVETDSALMCYSLQMK